MAHGAQSVKMEVRLEMQINRKQSDSTSVADMLSVLSTDVRNDLALLKKRQDQLFHKQDQIHCTLAGETPVSKTSGFRSPFCSSVLAWSSIPGKPPSQCTPKHQHYTSVTGHTLQHGEPSRSRDLDCLYDLSSLFSEEPYQSSLSDVYTLCKDRPRHTTCRFHVRTFTNTDSNLCISAMYFQPAKFF